MYRHLIKHGNLFAGQFAALYEYRYNYWQSDNANPIVVLQAGWKPGKLDYVSYDKVVTVPGYPPCRHKESYMYAAMEHYRYAKTWNPVVVSPANIFPISQVTINNHGLTHLLCPA